MSLNNTQEIYTECTLCPRECKVNRSERNGFCGSGTVMKVARIAPHLWEEPFLSGQGLESPVCGSGTVFFCGCNLGCVYCQNYKISRFSDKCENIGRSYTPSELADEFLRLETNGVHNINLVTAGHFAPSIAETLETARSRGLIIPIVYNTSSYEKVSTLKLLDGLIDIYLPDIKYFSKKLASDYSRAADYPNIARAAVAEMYRQTGKPRFDKKGFMLSGTVIRHLVLPGSDGDSAKVIEWIYQTFGSDGIGLSLMNQYTPVAETPFPELSEKLPKAAYLRVIEKAQRLGFKYLFTQADGTASESFIPEFTLTDN